MVSSKEAPQWVAVTHYGWRIPAISIFPNAVKITPVEGPDVRLIPWVNIIILAFLPSRCCSSGRCGGSFRERSVDPRWHGPAMPWEAVDARADAAAAEARGVWGRFTHWLGTWRAKPRK